MFGVSQYAAGTIPANSSIIQASKAINDSIGNTSMNVNYNFNDDQSQNNNVQELVSEFSRFLNNNTEQMVQLLNKLDDQQPTFEVHNDMIGDKLRTLIKQKDSREHNLNRFFPQGG